jgi:hypothetical protein
MELLKNSGKGGILLASKKKSIWSAVLSIIGIILFIASYLVSENPTSSEKIVIKLFFFSGIASMLVGIVGSVLAFKSMESGFLKYISFFIIILLIIGIVIAPIILIGLFGIE